MKFDIIMVNTIFKVIKLIAEKYKIQYMEALNDFYQSATYKLYEDKETEFFTKSATNLFSIYELEKQGRIREAFI